MSTTLIVQCDVCKKAKGEVNHWFLAFLVARIRAGENFTCIEFMAWDPQYAAEKDTIHLCGQACAQKLLDEFLGKQ